MLKGKKKALAAQVLLGLMVAGNAYAADVQILLSSLLYRFGLWV